MTTTDNTLRQIIDAIVSGPLIKPGEGFTVTLDLLRGAAVGEISPAWYFDQKVAGELRVVGDTSASQCLGAIGTYQPGVLNGHIELNAPDIMWKIARPSQSMSSTQSARQPHSLQRR
jgi:hypothetical protein